MKLTSEKALELLDQARGLAPDDFWIGHSICVGNTAGIIAKALGMDEGVAKTLGFIHDIGKRNGWGRNNKYSHPIAGYEYILNLGYDEEYANICLTHSYLNNDINCVAGGLPNTDRYRYEFVKNFVENHKYTEYEKLINLCDLMCTNKVLTMEKRLISLEIKYGVFSNTVYHLTEAQKLKKYFDDKLGYNLYTLFPELINN